jgi:hypothetical protein
VKLRHRAQDQPCRFVVNNVQIVYSCGCTVYLVNLKEPMAKPTPVLPAPADPLGETLHMLRLTGTLYCRGEFTAPFAIEIPELEGVMTFLVVSCAGVFGIRIPL